MKLSEWAKRRGITYKTAWRWVKEGKMPVPFEITPTGTILVHEPEPAKGGIVALYYRVSSSDQKADLERQVVRLLKFANAQGLSVGKTVKEIGSGLNGRRKELLKLLSDPNVTTIVVEHRDRLTRFGFEFLEAALRAQGRRILVVEEREVDDDLVCDMTEVLTSLAARLYGKRSAKRRAKKRWRRFDVKIHRAYRYELDPNKEQRILLAKHAGAARFAYNWGLARWKEIYENEGRTTSAYELHRELNRLKKTDFPWMYEVSKWAPQEALRDLEKAFRNFFRGLKAGRKVGYPKFRRKHDRRESFRLTVPERFGSFWTEAISVILARHDTSCSRGLELCV